MNYAIIIAILGLISIVYGLSKSREASKKDDTILNLNVEKVNFQSLAQELQANIFSLQEEVGLEREKNRALLSQKKSSETRLGQISEHLIPFLENCQHDPKNMHFLGNPIDYVVFNFDDGAITFLEVKSGNSKASKRQKTVKNIIKAGRVFYEEIRINEKGIRNRVVGLDGQVVTNIKSLGTVKLDDGIEEDDDSTTEQD